MRTAWRQARNFRSSREFGAASRALGDRLASLRAAQKLTQEEAADRIGITWRHLQRLESGEMNVTLVTLVRIAGAFGVQVGDLFAESDAP